MVPEDPEVPSGVDGPPRRAVRSGGMMKKERKCELCSDTIPQKNRDSLMDLGYTGVDIRAPVRKMMYFCPKHTAQEITASIETVIRPKKAEKCTRTDCETNPWMCDIPFEMMKDECRQQIDEDEAWAHWEDPGPEPEDPC